MRLRGDVLATTFGWMMVSYRRGEHGRWFARWRQTLSTIARMYEIIEIAIVNIIEEMLLRIFFILMEICLLILEIIKYFLNINIYIAKLHNTILA